MQFTGIIFGPVVMKQGLVDSNGDGVRRNVTVITMHTASDLRQLMHLSICGIGTSGNMKQT